MIHPSAAAPQISPIRIAVLTALAILAFAGNSLLTRAALADGAIGAGAFAAIRLGSGAALLAALLAMQGASRLRPSRRDAIAVGALALYMAGFSFAYLGLTAATGALILFATVQATMAGVSALRGAAPSRRELTGVAVALGGLTWLVAPGLAAPPLWASALMVAAGVGWGLYSLHGRGATDPLGDTARAFLGAALVALPWPLLDGDAVITAHGVGLAAASGALTSGLGYAVWYAVLPHLRPGAAGAAQLLTPVAAAVGGVMWLGEALSPMQVAAGMVILAGVAVAVRARSG